MATQPGAHLLWAFGPFEVNASAGELRKRSVRVRLGRQPFQILLLLLTHSGEVVTREQLREHVWGDGTFVDFEGGLNAAMAKLRRALGDSAEKPRYIETVPGSGYRFIGSLRESSASVASKSNETPTNLVVLTTSTSVQKKPAEIPKANTQRKITITTCLAALVIAVGAFYYFHRPAAVGAKGEIVLAEFVNRTGDPVFDETLRQGLAVQLEESPFLSIVSEERIQHTLALMGQPVGGRLTSDHAREVCERTASAAFLVGSIAPLGNQYILGMTAKSCAGDILDQEQVQAARKEDVLNGLTRIARKFRERAGESLSTIREHETPLAEATTPSLEALRAYSAAWNAAFTTGFTAAVPLLQRAIALDSQFAMAHAFLGRIYADTGESVLSAESTSRAYQLRGRASDRERFFITFSYDRQITGNLANAQKTLELWTRTYPRDPDPHSLLSGFTTTGTAQYEKTIAEAKKAISLNPDATPAYLNLADACLALGRVAEAESALVRAAERKLEIADSLTLRYSIAFLRDDKSGMDRELAQANQKPGAEDWMLHLNALVSAYSGHLQQARTLSDRAVELALRGGQRERAALYKVGTSVWEGLFGDSSAAKRSAYTALELSKARDVEYGAGIALALAQDSSHAQALANDLESRFPEDTFVRYTCGPTLRALVAANHHETAKSVQMLQTTAPYELALTWTRLFGGFGNLYPVYVRGIAYLALHQGVEAAAEFQKILDHRGIVIADPIGALAHLQLARALILSGDKVKAKAAYQDFLALWRDADLSVPIFKQAKQEYLKLQ